MAMKPIGREEALQHLFVLAICAFMIVAPLFMVSPPKLEWSIVALGVVFGMIDLLVVAALRRPKAE